jgi:hypothetical protein
MDETLPIIGIMGKAHSGKDTIGEMLVAAQDCETMAFADKLKSIVAEMFEIPIDELYTDEGKEKETEFARLMCPGCDSVAVDEVSMNDTEPLATCRECGTTGALEVFKSMWRRRDILQYVGTEGFRIIWKQVWVNFAMLKARRYLEQHNRCTVVFTDCRFKTEATAIWAAGGEVWRVKRPETDKTEEGIKGHASEMEQEEIPDSQCQAVIMNDGTLENLQGLVKAQLLRFNDRYR